MTTELECVFAVCRATVGGQLVMEPVVVEPVVLAMRNHTHHDPTQHYQTQTQEPDPQWPDELLDPDAAHKPQHKVHEPVTMALSVLLIYAAAGGALFAHWRPHNGYLDGAVTSFLSLATIGHLVEIDSNKRLVLTTAYVLVGLSLIAACVLVVARPLGRQLSKCGRWAGVIKDKRCKEFEQDE